MSHPNIYTDNNGARVIVRHRGPAGPGVPDGGTTGQLLAKNSNADQDTEWITNAALATGVTSAAAGTDGKIAVYDGAARAIKASTVVLDDLATAAALAGKMDITPKTVGGGYQVASDVNFTQAWETKLNGLTEHYRGAHGNLGALIIAVPVPQPGDFAVLTTLPSFAFCAVSPNWTELQVDMTGQEIADLIFDTDDTWAQEGCRIFTTADKDALASLTQILAGALGPGATITPYRTVDANYLVTAADRTIDVTANSPTITLPTALTNVGSVLVIKNSGAGVVTIACAIGGEEIDGTATLDLDPLESASLQSTGTGRGYIVI